ncbi:MULTISPECIES: DUF3263 domain-containing protein [Microbacterium]|uniref:DUF3263 domain-containing protein n=1 Tax=Microbacterium TaxID=33882 RepID=UPI0012B7903E|nr:MULTISPECIES: DUF3263 domain-containing protein [Microbacterium]MTE23423.1 DUF3263 domain-containing protein [Microbacterium sp. ZXX196]NHI17864.1 DUF3263 domain-containing protein [Microbacterium excoecariae]
MSDVHLGAPRPGAEQGGLDERSRAILAFEAEWPQHDGAKEEALRARFGMEPARYYQVLARLTDDPRAQAHAPLLIGRLRRLRDARAARRARLLH